MSEPGIRVSKSQVRSGRGRALKVLRTISARSTTDLARSVGFDPSYVTHFENGTRPISDENLANLSQALGVSVGLFLALAEDPTQLSIKHQHKEHLQKLAMEFFLFAFGIKNHED